MNCYIFTIIIVLAAVFGIGNELKRHEKILEKLDQKIDELKDKNH